MLLLPVFTIAFIRTMVRKDSNKTNAFVLGIYTVADALLAWLLIGAAIGPSEGSGLAATQARVEFTVRIYSNMTQEPQDGIDPELLSATDALLNAYSGDFQLGAAVMAVDLLGAYGAPLAAQSGYVTVDQTMFRVMDITLPMVIADAWTQAA